MFFSRSKSTIPTPEEALPGRTERPFHPRRSTWCSTRRWSPTSVPEGHEAAIFGLGCFWGAEEIYWQMPGVWSTSVGYAGGFTAHPSYEEVCSGRTGHTEAVRVVFDPKVVSYADLVKTFFEVHDPTQGMRQGNDVGTQYRSAIYATTPEQEQTAPTLTKEYGESSPAAASTPITTEIRAAARRRTTTPRTTTSSTCPRTPTGTAATARRGSRSHRASDSTSEGRRRQSGDPNVRP